jgi:hypothetical protein
MMARTALFRSASVALLAAVLGVCGASAQAETASTATSKKKAAKPVSSHQQLQSEAKGLALATDTAEAVNAAQLEISTRVLTGRADCEFNQNVNIDALADHPGYFRVAYGKQQYLMVPEETTTGAVRLVDKKTGVIWLQIPVKSMLIDTKAGHRLVDACLCAEQRAAVEATKNIVKVNSLE